MQVSNVFLPLFLDCNVDHIYRSSTWGGTAVNHVKNILKAQSFLRFTPKKATFNPPSVTNAVSKQKVRGT